MKNPRSAPHQGLAPASNLTLVQHNSLGSRDVFFSLFSSLTEGPPVNMVLLQDSPSSRSFLPSFSDFKSVAPRVARPKVACYVSQKLLLSLSVLAVVFSESEDFIALDVYTPQGCFGPTFPRFRICNAYARSTNTPSSSVPPERSFVSYGFPYRVAGDFNIHNPAVDPFRILTSNEATVTCIHVPEAVYRSGAQDFLCLVLIY